MSAELVHTASPSPSSFSNARSSPPSCNGSQGGKSTPQSTSLGVSDLPMPDQLRPSRSPSASPTCRHVEIGMKTPDAASKRKAPEALGPALAVSDLSISKRHCIRRSPRPSLVAQPSEPEVASDADQKQPGKKLENCSLSSTKERTRGSGGSFFVGDPVPDDEARRRWPWRYQEQGLQSNSKCIKSNDEDDDEDELVLNVKCHYSEAQVTKITLNLDDYVYVKGKKGGHNYIGRIQEFFKTADDEDYFRVQWLFRAEDTVMNEEAASLDQRHLFSSDLMNDNPLECIVSKINIIQVEPGATSKSKNFQTCDFYYDMKYSVDYSTFCKMVTDSTDMSSAYMKTVHMNGTMPKPELISLQKPVKSELALLDIFSGCGGMSTGLCLGAKVSGLDLVTRWSIDYNKSACDSLKLNHPEAQVRNESAEDFLDLLREWEKLCKRYARKTDEIQKTTRHNSMTPRRDKVSEVDASGELEVARLVDICYGDPSNSGKRALKFKVRWMGYGPSEDTWEPIKGLRNCQDHIRDFVLKGSKAKILPCPGDVDVICGGPPCQGISGYNRFRNSDCPLDDERNRQIVVFMDIVDFLKPRFVLMENVCDILKFAKGSLVRYAVSRLVHMGYQTRLGIMAAGCYGLPQFRLRVFLWGAHPRERLPQFPLPTHDVIVKYGSLVEFGRNVVAYDEGQSRNLEKALVLSDAISDLPPVTNDEIREQMSYKNHPQTEFEKFIRATEHEMMGCDFFGKSPKPVLFDHRPLRMSDEDLSRVRLIPQRKGACFRDLPGVVVGPDNVVRRDPTTEVLLPSGKQLVPEYAINFGDGKSSKPFGRLWWDETVPTVICKPNPRCQALLHPEQDRILTIRECARLQGFPDYYKFCGSVVDRYCQIGNAVSVPVGRAMGYALGMAAQKLSDDGHLMTLPPNFSLSTATELMRSMHRT